MISKKTAARVKEIDFIKILSSKEPAGLIRYLAAGASKLKMAKSEMFISASATYYGYLYNIKSDKKLKALEKDSNIIAWINSCLLSKRDLVNSLEIMLTGIYQFIQWEKEDAQSK